MKKSLLTLSIALAGLLGMPAHAQKAASGEDRAVPAEKTSLSEKAKAKAARRAEGAAAAKADQPGDDRPGTTASTKVSNTERLAAKAKRKAAGTEAEKSPKDPSTAAGGSN
jgi:NADH-quinone oxidoreductase subunit C/WASH complex subunit FAM21